MKIKILLFFGVAWFSFGSAIACDCVDSNHAGKGYSHLNLNLNQDTGFYEIDRFEYVSGDIEAYEASKIPFKFYLTKADPKDIELVFLESGSKELGILENVRARGSTLSGKKSEVRVGDKNVSMEIFGPQNPNSLVPRFFAQYTSPILHGYNVPNNLAKLYTKILGTEELRDESLYLEEMNKAFETFMQLGYKIVALYVSDNDGKTSQDKVNFGVGVRFKTITKLSDSATPEDINQRYYDDILSIKLLERFISFGQKSTFKLIKPLETGEDSFNTLDFYNNSRLFKVKENEHSFGRKEKNDKWFPTGKKKVLRIGNKLLYLPDSDSVLDSFKIIGPRREFGEPGIIFHGDVKKSDYTKYFWNSEALRIEQVND